MELETDSTRNKIIKATIELLDEKGFSSITTNKIAKKANVSEVTLFRKFGSKDNLLKVAKNSCLEIFFKKLDLILKEALTINFEGDLATYFKTIWYKIVEFLDNELDIFKMSIEELRDIPFEERVLPKISDKIISDLTKIFQKLIDGGNIRKINPEVAAITVFGVIFEAIILWKVYGKESVKSSDDYLNDFLNLFINGIKLGDVC